MKITLRGFQAIIAPLRTLIACLMTLQIPHLRLRFFPQEGVGARHESPVS